MAISQSDREKYKVSNLRGIFYGMANRDRTDLIFPNAPSRRCVLNRGDRPGKYVTRQRHTHQSQEVDLECMNKTVCGLPMESMFKRMADVISETCKTAPYVILFGTE